jgi:hypothetical protein
MQQEDTPETTTAHPRELRFRALRDAPSDKIRAGDLLVWRRDRPRASRVTIERATELHSGRLDRLSVEGVLEPLGVTFADARATMVNALLADQREDGGRP